MGKQQELRFEAFFPAAPEKVFAVFADHERFGKVWGASFKRVVDGQGAGGVNGVGSVRDIRMGLLRFQETTKTYESPKLIEYTVSAGKALIHDHWGRIELIPENGGTRLDYVIRYTPDLPFSGPVIAGIMRSSFKPKRVMELLDQ